MRKRRRPFVQGDQFVASLLDRPWYVAAPTERPSSEERTWADLQAHLQFLEWRREQERRQARDAAPEEPQRARERPAPQQGSVLSSLLAGGLIGAAAYVMLSEKESPVAEALRDSLRSIRPQADDGTAARPDAEAAARTAAARLGVSLTASEAEIRAALRTKLAESRLHPDHGGDGAEASKLIAAKNLLVERARRKA